MGEEYKRTVQVVGHVPVAKDIIFYEDFEGSWKWRGLGTGSDWVVAKVTSDYTVNNGTYCMELTTKATTPAVGDYVEGSRYVSLRQWKTVRFSMFFQPLTQAGYAYLEVRLKYYTGTAIVMAGVRWNRSTQRWQYLDSTGTWTDISADTQSLYEYAYHYMSFVVNFATGRLKELVCDGLVLSGLNLAFQQVASTAASFLYVLIAIGSNVAARQTIYVDDVMLQEVAV